MNGMMGRPVYNQRNILASSDATSDAPVFSICLGDFSKYALVERPGLEVSRNPYLYQRSGQVGIFAEFRQGGAPLLGEAFSLGTLTPNA